MAEYSSKPDEAYYYMMVGNTTILALMLIGTTYLRDCTERLE